MNLFENDIPFVLNQNIKRNTNIKSQDANFHKNIELQICNNGGGFVLINGELFRFEANDIIIINSDEIHYTDTNTFLESALNYINKNFANKITLDDISNALYLNKYSLSRKFKAITCLTVFEYITSCRCNSAAQMISQGKSIKYSALNCGYNNMSYFTKTFKRFMGKLPSDYKK